MSTLHMPALLIAISVVYLGASNMTIRMYSLTGLPNIAIFGKGHLTHLALLMLNQEI